ncbi:hypothetical protein LC55x_1012 [Lysobacter capsici]|nr:hypothetical protein LC55x_1012 [Lysobacter capsici]
MSSCGAGRDRTANSSGEIGRGDGLSAAGDNDRGCAAKFSVCGEI